jgi:hypothetical protein
VLKKRRKIRGPTYRDLPTLKLAPSEESEVDVWPVRKVTRKINRARISKKVVRFVEVPEVIPDNVTNIGWLGQDRKRKAECLDKDDGEGLQGGGWGWCAVIWEPWLDRVIRLDMM